MEKRVNVIFLEDSKGIIKINNKSGNLFLISNDEIKEDDWVICGQNDPYQIKKEDLTPLLNKYNKKIIATTDKSLSEQIMYYPDGEIIGGKDAYRTIPELPESFIQAYIKAYNEGKPITEVALEIEITHEGSGTYSIRLEDIVDAGLKPVQRIKTRPDNTVIVKESKKYSEVDLKKAFNAGMNFGMAMGEPNFEEWKKSGEI